MTYIYDAEMHLIFVKEMPFSLSGHDHCCVRFRVQKQPRRSTALQPVKNGRERQTKKKERKKEAAATTGPKTECWMNAGRAQEHYGCSERWRLACLLIHYLPSLVLSLSGVLLAFL